MSKARKSVSFTANGTNYDLVFTTNALVAFEKVSGVNTGRIAEVFVAAQNGDLAMQQLRNLLWAGLTESLPDITLRDVGPIIDDLTIKNAMKFVGEAIKKSFPSETADTTASGGAGNAPAATVDLT
jgi:hypothetical protein